MSEQLNTNLKLSYLGLLTLEVIDWVWGTEQSSTKVRLFIIVCFHDEIFTRRSSENHVKLLCNWTYNETFLINLALIKELKTKVNLYKS